jgi:hypothetical protein
MHVTPLLEPRGHLGRPVGVPRAENRGHQRGVMESEEVMEEAAFDPHLEVPGSGRSNSMSK